MADDPELVASTITGWTLERRAPALGAPEVS
jgi:hypothetical protein